MEDQNCKTDLGLPAVTIQSNGGQLRRTCETARHLALTGKEIEGDLRKRLSHGRGSLR